jgi:hypothetical protein
MHSVHVPGKECALLAFTESDKPQQFWFKSNTSMTFYMKVYITALLLKNVYKQN